ncbi:MAG: ester cyclase [Pseudomonadales bacterium]
MKLVTTLSRTIVTFIFLLITSLASATTVASSPTDIRHSSKVSVALQHTEVWGKGNFEIVPQIYAENYLGHWPGGVQKLHGRAEIEAEVARHRERNTDWKVSVLKVIEEGDHIATLSRVSTQLPEGKIEILEYNIFRMVNGQIAEQWMLRDSDSFSRQGRALAGNTDDSAKEDAHSTALADSGTAFAADIPDYTNFSNLQAVSLQHSQVWDKGNVALIPRIYSEDYIGHWQGGVKKIRGIPGITSEVVSFRGRFDDYQEKIIKTVQQGDHVVTQYISTATTKEGVFSIMEFGIFRMVNGQIAEQWSLPDLESFYTQFMDATGIDLRTDH